MILDLRTANRRRAWPLLAAALLCVGLCLSCSDEHDVDISARCLEFFADEGTPEGHVISRTGADSVCNFLDIELVATDLEQIHSAEIQLLYPNSLAFLQLLEVGPLLLGTDGVGVDCGRALAEYGVDCVLTDDFENGTIDLSISRTPQSPGTVDAPAEGAVLVKLTFLQLTTLTGAQGPFEFNFGKLLDDGNGGQTSPNAIIDVRVDPSTFVGGQLVIVEQ
jgi:hypothetical protein